MLIKIYPAARSVNQSPIVVQQLVHGDELEASGLQALDDLWQNEQ